MRAMPGWSPTMTLWCAVCPVAREGFALRLAQRAAEARGQATAGAAPLRLDRLPRARAARLTRALTTRRWSRACCQRASSRTRSCWWGARRAPRPSCRGRRPTCSIHRLAPQGGERLFPGVELQATLVDNYLTGGGLRTVPEELDAGPGVALLVPLLLWGNRRLHPGGRRSAGGGAGGGR